MANALVETKMLTLDEFMLRYDTEGPFEVINGEIIKLMPRLTEHSDISHVLLKALILFLHSNPLGEIRHETTFVLPDADRPNWVRGSRVPDLMFYSADRLKAYWEQTPNAKKKPFLLVPDLVIEILSPNDSYVDVAQKVELYLEDGVRLIWVFDPKRQQVAVHAPNMTVTFLSVEDELTGGEIIPGFKIAVSEIFA